MRQLKDFKKHFKIVLLVSLMLLPALCLRAQTAADLQGKIQQKDSDIEALEKEIASYQSQLNAISSQKNSLAGSIKQLDITRKKLLADINVTQNKIDRTNLTIDGLSNDIGDKEEAINSNVESIKDGMRAIDEYEHNSMVGVLLSEGDFASAWNDIDSIISLRERVRQNITDLKETKGELESAKAVTVKAKDDLVKLKSQLSDQQKIVVQNTNEKNKLLLQTKNSEASYQKLLKDRIAKRDAFEKELRDYEAQLQYILDPSKLPGSGVLSWPLDSVYVTQLFGKTVAAKRLYASGSHSGVDFRASVGTPVKAMADGKVLGTGNTDTVCPGASFGKYVFIQYNNGLSSTFGHLSLIKAQEGDIVKRGEVVGYSGATGHVTGPHLHVSLYASEAVKMTSKPSAACGGRVYTLPVAPTSAYLDAMYYLPPYKINSTILVNNPNE
jgi:murein DD-endopeptidase MepM/ murein hydrolase activator NlpD